MSDDRIFDGMEYAREGGWFPRVCSLVRWLERANCNDYVTLEAKELVALSHFPTPEVEAAALNNARDFLAYVYNSPPEHLTAAERKELDPLRRKAARFVQYRLRLLAIDEDATRRAIHNLESRIARDTPTSLEPVKAKRGKASINARMLETIQANPEALGWNSPRWAKHLRCAKSSIVGTPTWKDLTTRRDRERAQRAQDRRRRTKPSGRRSD